jgi:predicted dehydrogenase
MKGSKVRYAVVGLGHIAQNAVLPAFEHATENSELTALISGDDEKLKAVGERYNVQNRYHYGEFDKALADDTFDAVYICLPNNLHKQYTIKAADGGVHVLCEKPMAMCSRDCQEMISACEFNNVKLMIAYRLHFERANMEAVKTIQSGEIGKPRIFNASFSLQVTPDNYRISKEQGGGPLYDIGIYCINAARYLFKSEPVQVTALSVRSNDPRFREVDESVAAIMKFPDERLALFACSFAAFDDSRYEVIGTRGRLTLDPAFDYTNELKYILAQPEHQEQHVKPMVDQFAPEILHFSKCILEDLQPRPCGYEGLADIKVIEAIIESCKTGKAVELDFKLHQRTSEPDLTMVKDIPPAAKPPLVKVHSSSQ